MNKRQIARRATSDTHKKLMLAYHRARGGDRLRRWKELRDFMTSALVPTEAAPPHDHDGVRDSAASVAVASAPARR